MGLESRSRRFCGIVSLWYLAVESKREDVVTQTEFPFFCIPEKLKQFLVAWLALENKEDELREEKRLLKEQYTDYFPMRGVLTGPAGTYSRELLHRAGDIGGAGRRVDRRWREAWDNEHRQRGGIRWLKA